MAQGRILCLTHGMELVERIEVHKLNACNIVHLTLRNNMTQVIVHCFEGMRVTIGHRITQQGSVITDENKVNTPRINTYRCNLDTTSPYNLQTFYHLKIQGIDIPVEVASSFNKMVRKARQLLLLQSSIGQCPQNRTSTSSPQVNSKEMFLH